MKNTLWKQKKRKKSGFTLIEVMTVVVILGILITIGISNFITYSKKRANEATVLTNIRTLQVMLETYRVDEKAYPDNLSELQVEAIKKNYYKPVINPYTHKGNVLNDWTSACYDLASPPANRDIYIGTACYTAVGVSATKYYLMGYDDKGLPILKNNTPYLVTNGG